MNGNLKTRIMVFGTFDILHQGHLNFFKQARQLAKRPFLIVSVARDINVKKIKGQSPMHSQGLRLKALKGLKLVNKAVMGEKDNYIRHILLARPEIIALGYDQKAYTKNLRQILKAKGLNIKIRRLKPYFPKKYKTSLFKTKMV